MSERTIIRYAGTGYRYVVAEERPNGTMLLEPIRDEGEAQSVSNSLLSTLIAEGVVVVVKGSL